MKDKLKVLVVCAIFIGLAVGCVKLSETRYEEGVKVEKFYISEGKTLLNKETYYILSNDKVKCSAKEPDLILYCSQHVGEVVKIKVKYRYDKTDKEYEHLEFISIEEGEE